MTPLRDNFRVSLIVTVKNEAGSIGRLLDSISTQARLPDEVVVADGGSCDQTVAALETWGVRQPFPVRVLSVPGANISQGRNAAIHAAAGPIIASTDAGVRLDPQWLAKLSDGFLVEGKASSADAHQTRATLTRDTAVVSGFFVPDPQNAFEVAMSATVLPALADVDLQAFLPSSRSIAFTKEAWQAVGGYPEWLDYCEDLFFDFALRERYTFAFAPDAVAYFRPRGSLRSFFRQYYLYARGDGKADLWRKRHAIRYASYGIGVPVLLALCFANPPWGCGLALLAGLAGGYGYMRTPYRRLLAYLPRMTSAEAAYAALLVPIIRVTGDVAKMLGYPVGVWWRMRRRAQ